MNFNKKFLVAKKIGIFVLTAIIILSPVAVSSAGLVPCGGTSSTGAKEDPCNYKHLIALANNIIDFLIRASVVIALLLFTYAGFLLVFSGGDVGARSKAMAIFWNVVKGLVIALAAWLIIETILNVLLKGDGFRQYVPL